MKTIIKTYVPFIAIGLLLACLELSPEAQAVVPPPDGGYPGSNTAEGQNALLSRTTGTFNTAIGFFSLRALNTASFCTGLGAGTLLANTAGENTATGAGALYSNTTGDGNTANGLSALAFNTTGAFNIALGTSAGQNLTTGDRNIDIGNLGIADEGHTIRIGTTGDQSATYIAGIAGQTVGAGGSTCYVDNDGKLGVFLSAHRFKTDIADMATASEAILALRPVTFHYKPELDKTGIPQFGLVAEEVEAINPDLVTRDKEGKVSTVRYEAVNAMLLNEFLKEHCKNQKQEATIARLEKQIEVLAEGLQKVSAELESAK